MVAVTGIFVEMHRYSRSRMHACNSNIRCRVARRAGAGAYNSAFCALARGCTTLFSLFYVLFSIFCRQFFGGRHHHHQRTERRVVFLSKARNLCAPNKKHLKLDKAWIANLWKSTTHKNIVLASNYGP